MNAPTPHESVGFIIGARDRDGRREAAIGRVFTNLDSCKTQRRLEPRDLIVPGDILCDYELHWPGPPVEGYPDRWYIAIAEYQRKQPRLEIAHHAFRGTMPEAQSDIDELRRDYPVYAAAASRFFVCEVREVLT